MENHYFFLSAIILFRHDMTCHPRSPNLSKAALHIIAGQLNEDQIKVPPGAAMGVSLKCSRKFKSLTKNLNEFDNYKKFWVQHLGDGYCTHFFAFFLGRSHTKRRISHPSTGVERHLHGLGQERCGVQFWDRVKSLPLKFGTFFGGSMVIFSS